MSSIELVDDRWPAPPPRDKVRSTFGCPFCNIPCDAHSGETQEFPWLLKCDYVAVIDSEDVRSSSMSRTVGFSLQ